MIFDCPKTLRSYRSFFTVIYLLILTLYHRTRILATINEAFTDIPENKGIITKSESFRSFAFLVFL